MAFFNVSVKSYNHVCNIFVKEHVFHGAEWRSCPYNCWLSIFIRESFTISRKHIDIYILNYC